jgi:hypothetical protein
MHGAFAEMLGMVRRWRGDGAGMVRGWCGMVRRDWRGCEGIRPDGVRGMILRRYVDRLYVPFHCSLLGVKGRAGGRAGLGLWAITASGLASGLEKGY